MTEISLEKSTAVNLVRFKLFSLQSEIEKILHKWNEELVQTFLQKAKNGTYEEAEDDAIDLHQLVKEEQEMQVLLERIGVLK
ncbi:hypothetical protein NEF87_003209 [Candidatus Lokiarchaeum ossiferum]|uniref:CopG family transcriptional regulator n=1 Tax=Candidatus Lokiarchaeum ossiferum TaxID=2951803 RepID=A0ABY6HWJ4_9ARCH|nr:hypothetical protein NEF87_003209 [Candidatus Lokiarchaeum sp. B-35]